MTSHTIYSSLDQEVPATVSRKILSDLLRQEMGFDGLVITDDLEMGAIEREQPLESAAVKALSAGADLLLICHDHTKVVNAFNAVDEARKRGELSLKGLTASMSRVAAVRSSFVTGH
jgi:beta-N-acetylhexosaminidase